MYLAGDPLRSVPGSLLLLAAALGSLQLTVVKSSKTGGFMLSLLIDYFSFFTFWLWVTPCSANGFLLTLCSEVTLDDAQGVKPGLTACKAGTLPTVQALWPLCSVSPVLSHERLTSQLPFGLHFRTCTWHVSSLCFVRLHR